MALLLLSLFGGALTILSPCVLPLLPIIIGGSLVKKDHDRLRPFIITASLALSIVVFTLALKWSTAFIAVPPRTWSIISGSLVVGLGIITLFPLLWERFALKLKLSERSNQVLVKSSQKKNRLGSVLVGLSLGPVFSSCSPTYALILATVLPQSFFVGTLNLLAYALGLSFVLLLIAVFGQRIVQKLKWAANPEGWFKKALGVLFIIVGVSILIGVDKKIETALVERGFGITDLEMRLVEDVAIEEEMDINESSFISPDFMSAETSEEMDNSGVEFTVKTPIPAPELQGVGPWINSDALTLADLKGKVVIVDFWTYSCINCIRTLPFLNEWHEKYADDGLVIVGVHAPEFAFEREEMNVQKAVEEYGVHYPVALDNNFVTWRAYNNRYWPAKYFIDRQGRLRHYHFGEGEYEESEAVIRALLTEGGEDLEDEMAEAGDENEPPISREQTPETYLGYARYKHFANKATAVRDKEVAYTLAEELASDEWTLGGNWRIEDERIVAGSDAVLRIQANAKDVYLVMDSDSVQEVSVSYNDKTAEVIVDGAALYDIMNAESFQKDVLIELRVPLGVGLHAFTFGS